MARTYEDIKNRIKNKEEKESKNIVSSSESRADRITKKRQEKSIGLDTLESDLHTMGETLNNIYGSWQTKETMDNTFESVNNMYTRLGKYQDYYTQYGKESGLPDLSELLNNYKNAIDKWGERTELYGQYKNADAFNKAVKDYQLSEKFKGLSYGDVQALMRKYSSDPDAYNYLKNYTGYTSVEDFDKALAGLSTDIGMFDKANEYEGRISSYEGRADVFKGRTRGLTNDGGYGKKADDTRVEYNAWLTEKGFDSGDAVKAEFFDEVKLAKELGKAKNIYDLDNSTADKYKYLEQNEDFAEHSQYDSSVNEGKKPHYQPFTNYDIRYDYINNVPEIRNSYERKAGNKNAGTAFSDNGWEYLTEKELAYYNYLHYLDDQNGTKKSDKFLEDLKPALQKRYSEKASERREEMLENPFAATAFSLVSPIMTMAGGVGNLMATGKDIVTGSEYNPYDPLREISNANTHGREVVSQNIAEATKGFELFGQNIASFLYNTGESVLDTVVGGSGFGPGYTVLMGTNAYQQKAKELTEQGYDATTVQGLAITSGVLEMAFEYAGFDHLMKLKDADSIGKVIYNALVSQGGAEGLEELGTSIGNMIAEYGFLGEDSQFVKQYNDLLARGFSEKEASIEVAKAMASELAWSYAGGWLSGVGLGTGTSVGQYTQNKAVGKDLRGAEQIGDVLNIASMTPEESEAYEAYTRYANKGVTADNITDAQLGNLYNTMSSDVKGGFRTAVTDLANAHGEMTTQRTTLGYEYESAKKDMLSAKAEIDTLKGIIDSKESTEVQKASASADLDNAIAKYNEAQQRMNRAYEPAVASESLTDRQRNKAQNKLDKAVSEYTDAQTRFGKYAPIADKLSGVEESVGAYNAKRTIEKAEAEKRAKHEAEVKKLSSGVETSVMADTDKAIEIKGMKDSDTLITSDGEVKLKDVELSDRDADLVAYARGMEASEASLYLEQYKGEENIEEYTNTFSLVTSMAKNNYSEDAILKAKGSLSTEQFNAIYAATVTERYREKQRNIDKLNAEMAGKMSYKGVVGDSVINYGNKAVKGKVNWNELNSRQREAVTFISGFAKATGMNLKLIADGEKKGINGSYDPSTNTITIDVYAGISKAKNLLKDTIIPTMSHETTHWMKEKSPELYRKIGDLVFKTLEAHDGISEVDRVASEVARHNAKGRNITDDGARDEIIARACEDMLKMSEEGKKYFNSLSESEKKTFIDKVKEILANLMEWVDNLLNSYSSDRYEAKVMREYKDTLAELSRLWDEMLVSSVKNNSSMELAGVFGHLTNGVSEDGTTIVGEKALQMSDRTYREGGRDFLVNWLENQKGISEDDKLNIIEQTDRIAELMRAVAEDNELPDYSAWADMEVVKDENGEKLLSVIVKNGDYAMNIDFSQVCKKRVALNAVLNAMVQSGDLNVHTLTETDVAELNAIIKEHDFEIACALCFVDSKRYRVGAWAESFCDGSDEKVKGKGMVHKYGFNEMVRSLVPKGSKLKVDEFNFTGRDIAGQPTQNLVSEADDSELDFTLIDKIMSENDVKSAQHRYARAIKEHPEIRKILNKAEIISSIGLDAIRLEAPELYKIVNGHQGTAKPKFSHDVVAYGNDILKASNFTAEKAKMVGGVRCQSFSDFMANMVVDYAQFISELSAKGLTSHSYTKEPLFVKLFGLTGMKINMSLVPKAIDMTPEQQERFAILKDKNANKRSKAYKEALAEYNKLAENAGLDENGNYIWEDETFPYDIAMDIVVDPRYSANCGTIAVGISNKHILKLLADDRISMVIPYHKSGLNHEVAMMRDIALYNDYTKVQSTRFGYYKSLFGGNAGKKLDGVPDFDFYGDLYGVDGKEGTHDPKTTAQNYLNWCDRHNYIPKFDEFRGNPNYYKLLIDFRVYDVDGTYREQQPVKAIYPSNAEFKDLILNGVVDKNGKVYGGLKQQQQTSDKLSAETQQIVDEYRQRLTEKYGEDVLVQNDDRDGDISESEEFADSNVLYSIREEEPPIKTVKGYKVFVVKDGKLYPPMVANPNGADTPVGIWLNADIGASAPDSKTGRKQVKAGGKGTQGGSGSLAFRPGWHLGEVPIATQFNRLNPETGIKELFPENFVWAECDVAADVDYQEEAMSYGYTENGKFRHSYAGLPRLPIDGFYKYRTNPNPETVPWLITGAMKVNRVLSDAEVNKILRDNNIEPPKRQGGEKSLRDLGLEQYVQNSDRDSDGEALTKEQIEFFKNSKVRDANGRLLVVYHGTPNRNVNEFSYDYVGSVGGSNHGHGFYFTDVKREATLYAQGIGEVKKAYLNITNPIYSESIDLKNRIEEMFERLPIYARNALKAEYGDLNNAKSYFQEYITKNKNGAFLSLFPGKANMHPEVFNRQVLNNMGYDGIIYKEDGYSDEYVVFQSNQAKLTTNTNPTMSDDIRYSDRDEDLSVFEEMGEAYRIEEETEWLKEDIKWLKERVKLEGQVTNGKYFKDSSIVAAAEALLKKVESKYDKVQLARSLRDLYHFIRSAGSEADTDVVMQKAHDIARQILSGAKPMVVKNDYYAKLLSEIKKTRVRFNKNQKAECSARIGKNWNRSFFGKIILADDARTELDQQWKEWAEEYPDIFDAHVKDGDQPMELYEILTSLKANSEIVEEYNNEENAMWLVKEILNQYWNLTPLVTTADKYSKQIKELTSKHRQKMKEARDDYNARVEEAKLAERMFYGKKMSEMRKEYDAKLEKQRKTDSAKMADKLAEAKEQHEAELYEKELAERMHFGAEIAKLRRQKDEKVAEAKEHGKQKMAEYKESVAKKTKIKSITSRALELNKKLELNSKDKHIPEALKGPVAELLQAIDFSSKRLLEGGNATKDDVRIGEALRNVKDAIVDDSQKAEDFIAELYGSGLDDSLKNLVKNVDIVTKNLSPGEFVLQKMSLEDLTELSKVVNIISNAVNQLNKFHTMQRNLGIDQAAERSMGELAEMEKVYDDNKKHFDKLKTKVYWNNLTPWYAFKNLGSTLQKVFTSFMNAQDKIAFLADELIKFTNELYTDKDYEKWSDKYFEFEAAQPDGKTAKFSMNVPQIMSLHCLYKQEDAKRHLLYGKADGKDKGKGKGITITETEKTRGVTKNILLSEADINNIISKIKDVKNIKGDKTAIEVADKLQEFMGKRGAELGNEITMARWGIKSFGIENYFPIKVSKGTVRNNKDVPGVNTKSMLALLNASFTHARNDFAAQSIEIGDIFDVFSGHMSDMIRYNALALPILDMYRLINRTFVDENGNEHSFETSVTDTFGEHAWNYVRTFLYDVNGELKSDERDGIMIKFFKNSKIAKVAGNIRVWLLQYTSFFRASAVMDDKYLWKTFHVFFHAKNAKERAKEHCGIAKWKSLGFYSVDISRNLTEQIKHTKSLKNKAVELSLKGVEKADERTMAVLWTACELEIRDKRKDLKVGSDEFNEAVNERLREVVYRTQVVDSVMTRSQIMRSTGTFDKMLTAFGSENALSFNLMTDVFVTMKLEERRLSKTMTKKDARKLAIKKHGKYARKAITAYVVTNLASAALQTMFDAFRDYDEEEKDEEYFLKLMIENFLLNSSFINKLPGINSLVSTMQGFTTSRGDADWMAYLYKGYEEISKNGFTEKAFRNVLRAASDASGIAGYNVYRDAVAFYELINGD